MNDIAWIDAALIAARPQAVGALLRYFRDLDMAEEAFQNACLRALKAWPQNGAPRDPAAWLIMVGRNTGIDAMRRMKKQQPLPDEALISDTDDAEATLAERLDGEQYRDDVLRLLFICCHPDLPAAQQIALALRIVSGLTVQQIARAFLVGDSAMEQRITRAKARIAAAAVPFEAPDAIARAERLAAVAAMIYLVFNEGYSASSGASLTRADLSGEAIRLGRLLLELLPEPEVAGLLALMLLHESRRPARTSATGEIVLLDQQDRSRWDRSLITEGLALVERALTSRRFGPYTLQAAIAAVHAEAPSGAATDWAQIVALYDLLARAASSPIVDLNRAVAVAMRDGPAAGLALVDAILAQGELTDYHLIHATRADLCRRLGDRTGARNSYERALALTKQEPERRFLEQRLAELQ